MGIEIKGLCKKLGGKDVLKGVDLDIFDGEVITIIGASGMGKTVLFKHIVGLTKPDSGSIIVDGTDITAIDEDNLLKVQAKFGMLFQGAALFDSLSVFENVAFGLKRLTNMNESQIKRRVAEVLNMVSLPGTERLSISSLSGGMKKRVGLARALATSPKYLFYDEPTTGLDPLLAESISDLIIKVNNDLNITSVVVTHDMHSAFKVSHRLAFLYDGIIKTVGSVDDIKKTEIASLRDFINVGM
ncbi:MAG: ABC transporter ATP-binding protein [Elusimicrobia bacterium CG08_land_8_20_14_0_20_44_26]|nr:MAG: ABC transporter ATP-binding protein [Elusimicrobia bacterium CG08_land_8_20_14_0_20_44_26]